MYNIDLQNLMSDQQTLAFAAGAANSTGVVDLGAPGTMQPNGGTAPADLGLGTEMPFFGIVTEAVTSAGAATVQIQLVNSNNSDLTSGTVLWDSGAIAKATLIAGYRLLLRSIPPGCTKRYLGLIITVAAATTTAGKLTAGIGAFPQSAPV